MLFAPYWLLIEAIPHRSISHRPTPNLQPMLQAPNFGTMMMMMMVMMMMTVFPAGTAFAAVRRGGRSRSKGREYPLRSDGFFNGSARQPFAQALQPFARSWRDDDDDYEC